MVDQAWQRWLETRATDSPDLTARNMIIESVLPIIVSIAKKRCLSMRRGGLISVKDMVSVATLAMPKIMMNFDPSRKVKLTTYMSQRINGAMSDWLREIDWVPRLARSRASKGLDHVPGIASIDKVVVEGETRNVTRGDGLEDRHDHFAEVDDRENFKRLLVGLSRETRLILTLYHVEEMTMKQIGKVVGLSESRVSQMISQAYAILRAKPEIQEAGELMCTGDAGRENNRS